MKALNQTLSLTTQLKKMNKPKRHKSPVVQKLQQDRSVAEFEKTKKRMMLAAKIQDAVKGKNITYKAFATIMDQHVSVISKWVSGTHNFTIDTLFDIEDKLGVCLVSISDEQPTIIVKKYLTVVRNSDSVKWDSIPKTGLTKLNSEGSIIITASPLESHQHIGLPILNYSKHDC